MSVINEHQHKWIVKDQKECTQEVWHPTTLCETEISLTGLQVACSVLSAEGPPLISETPEGPSDTTIDGFIATYSGWLRYEERHGGDVAALENDNPSAEGEQISYW